MLAIVYRSRNVPQALMNLIPNKRIAEHKDVENDDDLHARLQGRVSEIRRRLFESFGRRRFIRNRIRQRAAVQDRHKCQEQRLVEWSRSLCGRETKAYDPGLIQIKIHIVRSANHTQI